VVVLADHLQHGHRDPIEVDQLAAEFELVPVEAVLLVDVLEELPVGDAGDVDGVVEPLLHPSEVGDELLVVEVVDEVAVLRDVVRDRIHQREARVEELGRDVAEGVHDRRRIVHGTLVSGTISAALARLPGLTIYLSHDLQFLKPVDVGETVVAVCGVVEDLGDDRYRLKTTVENET
jgi:hypothetical protein